MANNKRTHTQIVNLKKERQYYKLIAANYRIQMRVYVYEYFFATFTYQLVRLHTVYFMPFHFFFYILIR